MQPTTQKKLSEIIQQVDELNLKNGLIEDLNDLAVELERREVEYAQVLNIAGMIEQGMTLEDVLERIYERLSVIIPYSRIGFSLINEATGEVYAHWAKTDAPEPLIGIGYTALIADTSLGNVIESRQPRILNDLEGYLEEHPRSESTRLIVKEGHRASLTCPLILDGRPIGFLFFSCRDKDAYRDAHVQVLQLIANQLASAVARGRLISRLNEQNDLLEERNDELERLNQLKNTFLSIASHDLRSPISFIKMVLTAFSDPDFPIPDEQREQFLNDMLSQTDHMLHLLNNILDVSKIESGRFEINEEEMTLEAFITDAIQYQQTMASKKNSIVRLVSCPDGKLYADPNMIRQVLDNLISNALKFSPPGSEIQIRVQEADGWLISVKDQGPGIKPEERDKLFQYFTRLSAQPTARESSHGLGLAISREIVEAHGGWIDVESIPGQGATFKFFIPWK